MGFVKFGSVITFLLFLYPVLHAQEQSAEAKNSVFAEYVLEGPAYSINYERIFASSISLHYYFRAGFSAVKDKMALPLGAGVFTGNQYHHADFGLMVTPLVEKKEVYGGGTDNDTFIYLFPGAGYRFQKPAGGLHFRVMAGPAIILDPAEGDFWNMDPKLRFSFSIGAGYSF